LKSGRKSVKLSPFEQKELDDVTAALDALGVTKTEPTEKIEKKDSMVNLMSSPMHEK
jgi:hypothetical protein